MQQNRPKSSIHWTNEEKATLLELIKQESRDSGWVVSGFDANTAKILDRTPSAVAAFRQRLVKAGSLPKAVERATFKPLVLTDVDAGYLAGILDGDGTIHFGFYKIQPTANDRAGRECSVRLHIVLVYNTDKGILDKVAALVPFSKVKKAINSGKGKKTLYGVYVNGYRNTYVVLKRLLPLLAHENKI